MTDPKHNDAVIDGNGKLWQYDDTEMRWFECEQGAGFYTDLGDLDDFEDGATRLVKELDAVADHENELQEPLDRALDRAEKAEANYGREHAAHLKTIEISENHVGSLKAEIERLTSILNAARAVQRVASEDEAYIGAARRYYEDMGSVLGGAPMQAADTPDFRAQRDIAIRDLANLREQLATVIEAAKEHMVALEKQADAQARWLTASSSINSATAAVVRTGRAWEAAKAAASEDEGER